MLNYPQLKAKHDSDIETKIEPFCTVSNYVELGNNLSLQELAIELQGVSKKHSIEVNDINIISASGNRF